MPLIIKVPGAAGAASRGGRARGIVELVDLYRTYADIFGLGPVEPGVEGKSFAPLLLRSPSLPHSEYAFSQYPRCALDNPAEDWTGQDCMTFPRTAIGHMGFSVRSESMRYTECA